MTISNPFLEAAFIVFVVAFIASVILNVNAQRKNAENLKIARAEKQKSEEEARRRIRDSQERTDKINERTEQRQLIQNERDRRWEEQHRKSAEIQERWEKVVTRLESMLNKLEKRNDA